MIRKSFFGAAILGGRFQSIYDGVQLRPSPSRNSYSNVRQLHSQDESRHLILDKEGNVSIIGLNRPKNRNAMTRQMWNELLEAIKQFDENNAQNICVLYGEGGTFCSGVDLSEIDTEWIEKDVTLQSSPISTTKPIVAGINGICSGRGLELALMCDLRVMEEDALLLFANRQQGLPMLSSTLKQLILIVGHSRAMDLVLTGRQILADEALQIGLVNRIVAPGTAFGQSVNLARCITKFPQDALRYDRNRLIRLSQYNQNDFDNENIRDISSRIISELRIKTDGITDSETGINRLVNNVYKTPDWEIEEIRHSLNRIKKNKKQK